MVWSAHRASRHKAVRGEYALGRLRQQQITRASLARRPVERHTRITLNSPTLSPTGNETLPVEDPDSELFDGIACVLLPLFINLALICAWWWRGDGWSWLGGASVALLATLLVLRGGATRPFIRRLATLLCLVTLAACVGMVAGQQLWLAGWDPLDPSDLLQQLWTACRFGMVFGWVFGVVLALRLSGAQLVAHPSLVLAVGPLFVLPIAFANRAAAIVFDGALLCVVSALCAAIAWSLWRRCTAWKAPHVFLVMAYLLVPVMMLAWPEVEGASRGIPVALLGLLAPLAFYAAGWRRTQGRLVFGLAVFASIPFAHYALLHWGAGWALGWLLIVGAIFWQLAGRYGLSTQVVAEIRVPKKPPQKQSWAQQWQAVRGFAGLMSLVLLLIHLLEWGTLVAEEPRPTRAALEYFALIKDASDGAIDPVKLIHADTLVARLFEEEYLWPEKVHAAAATTDTVAAALRASVTRKADPYSTGMQTDRQEAWIGGHPTGLGVRLDRDKAGWFLADVMRDSPAEAAGLKKGMRLVQVDGELVGERLPKRWQEFRRQENVIGTEVRLGVRPPTASGEAMLAVREIAVRSGPIRLASQVVAEILPTENGPVGFLFFSHFDNDSWAEVEQKLDVFLAAGVKDMVIDLTENGGGLSVLSKRLASRLVAARYHGAPFIQSNHRPRWARFDSWQNLDVSANKTLALRRLYVLASNDTCSASEMFITGLRPYLDLVQIGSFTCGKPYGMFPFTIGDEVLSLVITEMHNARRETYREGLISDCFDVEVFFRSLDRSKALADDVLVSHALQHMRTGECRPVK